MVHARCGRAETGREWPKQAQAHGIWIARFDDLLTCRREMAGKPAQAVGGSRVRLLELPQEMQIRIEPLAFSSIKDGNYRGGPCKS
jgi:hypothetical protein